MENNEISTYKGPEIQRVEVRRVDEIPQGILLSRNKIYVERQIYETKLVLDSKI